MPFFSHKDHHPVNQYSSKRKAYLTHNKPEAQLKCLTNYVNQAYTIQARPIRDNVKINYHK